MKLRLSRFIPGQTWPRRAGALGAMILTLALAACGALTLASWQHGGTSGFKSPGATSAMGGADTARTSPLAIRPVVGHSIPVSAAQREWIQQQIRPLDRKHNAVSLCLHVLRVHGLGARFHHGDLLSSESILELLTNERMSQAYFGKPTLVRTRSGVRYPTVSSLINTPDRSEETHRDQVLAAFGELGIPLSYPLNLGNETSSVREVLRDSIANFHLQQQELPWTALAYALYLPPNTSWVNRYGESTSFDELVTELLNRPLDKSSCAGTHLIYTLTVLARVDQQQPVLTQASRDRLWQRLHRIVNCAVASQEPDGSWSIDWHRELQEGNGSHNFSSDARLFKSRLLATGHLAEWLLYLPVEEQVDKKCLRRAGWWLYEQLRVASPEMLKEDFCPYSHAACVLRQLTFVCQEEPSGSLIRGE